MVVIRRHEVLGRTGHFQALAAVLQIHKGRQGRRGTVFRTEEDIHLVPFAVVAEPGKTGIIVILSPPVGPEHVAEHVSVVAGQVQAARHIQGVATIRQGRIQHAVGIVHLLPDNEITRIGRLYPDSKGFRHRIIHIILEIAVTLGEIERGAPGQLAREPVGIVGLQMMLAVVIRLIIIIELIPQRIVVGSGGIIGPVLFHLLAGNAQPGNAGVLLAHEPGQAEGIVLPHLPHHGQGRLDIRFRIADVAFCVAARISALRVPSARKQSGTGRCGGDKGSERSEGQFHPSGRFRSHRSGAHVDARAEGTRPIGRCAQTALHLHGGKQGGQRRDVHPENLLRLGIVQRDAVQGNVDLRPL